MGVLKLTFQMVLGTALIALILMCTPGIPPKMQFEPYTVTPAMKLEGKLAKNNILDRAELVAENEFVGPESIAVQGDFIYTGVVGGHILRLKQGKWEKVLQTGKPCAGHWEGEICGRPLGLRFDSSGKLLVMDSSIGLLRVDVDKKTAETLVPRYGKIDGHHHPLNFGDDVDVSKKDGTIYFSDAGVHGTFGEITDWIGEPTGRLIKYDPKTKKTQVLLERIRFANGVQLSKNEDYVLLAESGLGRVVKYHLTGPKKGSSDVFIDGLPGYPDNIRPNGKGGYFISLIVSRPEDGPDHLDRLAGLPWARKILLRLQTILVKIFELANAYVPHELFGKAKAYASHLGPIGDIQQTPTKVIIVQADENGNVLGSLQSQDGKISYISEVNVGETYTYFGSPFTPRLWRIKTEYIK